MKKIITILLVLFSIPYCSQVIVTDRPDQTESSTVIPKGSFQIESGFLIEQLEQNSFNREQTVYLPTSLFRIGILKGFEFRIVNQLVSKKANFAFTSNKRIGFGDLEIGFKFQLFRKEDTKTEVALLHHFSLPTGAINLTSGFVGSNTKLLISHTLTDNFSIGYNLGYYYLNSNKGDFNYSLAFAYGINSKLSIYIEPYGVIEEMNDLVINVDGGFAYLVKDSFQLDFSFATGVNHNMNYLSVGFSVNISKDS